MGDPAKNDKLVSRFRGQCITRLGVVSAAERVDRQGRKGKIGTPRTACVAWGAEWVPDAGDLGGLPDHGIARVGRRGIGTEESRLVSLLLTH